MTLINIISALGNNDSVYPLLVRDCGIENVAKCVLTYKQNAKDSKFIARQATRERIIDEYGTSAVWLGGIPLMNKIVDKVIDKTGYCSKIDPKLLDDKNVQGLSANIKKFKALAPKAVEELQKVKDNKNAFRNLQIGKLLATTLIPIAVMGFMLPKFNFSITKKKIEEAKAKNKTTENSPKNNSKKDDMKSFMEKSKNLNFTGLNSLMNISNLQKMEILDGGLSVGRVKTGRNKEEKAEMAFKMAGMCYLNYLAPKTIDKGLNKLTKKIFKINSELDPKILSDDTFIKQIKEDKIVLPDCKDEKSIIEFIDSNVTSPFVKLTQKLKLVTLLDDNSVRDPRKYVDTKKIADLKKSVESFKKDAIDFGSVEEFAKKALKAKSFNIIINVLLSSFLLAIMLPKAQFLFRKITTKSNLEPGIKLDENDNKKLNS